MLDSIVDLRVIPMVVSETELTVIFIEKSHEHSHSRNSDHGMVLLTRVLAYSQPRKKANL